ncbi:MAG: phosphoribosyltransferase, partial [Gammaproteobacteria bacterium]|nr:phosphoribosyltransferase [Gammaproteobacteria bacterium]
MFHDREHAARELVERLAAYRGRHALVLAIPRGAVPMGRIIADALEGELDVVLVHKLGAPGNPEFAIGAVDETGEVFLSRDAQVMGIDQRYIEREAQSQLAVLRERRERYTPVRPPIDPKDRTVIVVDDGVATGATFTAALRAVRSKGPEWLCAAAAVIAPSSAARLRGE